MGPLKIVFRTDGCGQPKREPGGAALLARANTAPAAQAAPAAANMGPRPIRFHRKEGSSTRPSRDKDHGQQEPSNGSPPCEARKGHLVEPATALEKPQASWEDGASQVPEGVLKVHGSSPPYMNPKIMGNNTTTTTAQTRYTGRKLVCHRSMEANPSPATQEERVEDGRPTQVGQQDQVLAQGRHPVRGEAELGDPAPGWPRGPWRQPGGRTPPARTGACRRTRAPHGDPGRRWRTGGGPPPPPEAGRKR